MLGLTVGWVPKTRQRRMKEQPGKIPLMAINVFLLLLLEFHHQSLYEHAHPTLPIALKWGRVARVIAEYFWVDFLHELEAPVFYRGPPDCVRIIDNDVEATIFLVGTIGKDEVI